MTSVLFVCLGNICRSPMAESVFQHLVVQAGLADQVVVDSAGTGNWHVGQEADARTLNLLKQKGYPKPSRARQLNPDDADRFDLVLAMDQANLTAIRQVSRHFEPRLRLVLEPTLGAGHEVPDPYYGSAKDFDHVHDLLLPACHAWITEIQTYLEEA